MTLRLSTSHAMGWEDLLFGQLSNLWPYAFFQIVVRQCSGWKSWAPYCLGWEENSNLIQEKVSQERTLSIISKMSLPHAFLDSDQHFLYEENELTGVERLMNFLHFSDDAYELWRKKT